MQWLPNLLRARKRSALLVEAAAWPTVEARLLRSTIVAKHPLATDGTAFQDSQIESAYWFSLKGGYFGGHLRSVPVSDSEGHRLLRALPEDLPVKVRYDAANPDRTLVLPEDNKSFPVEIWPG